MLVEVFSFLHTNWQNIFITLTGGTIFYLLSNYAIKNYINSAEKERIKQAKNTLLDILESRVINKQDISFEKINNLMNAISREYSIVLFDIITPRSLLQDLELVFEKSHHLDSSQKDEYCKQIEEQINKIDEIRKELKPQVEIPKDYLDIIERLSEEIRVSDSTNAQNTLSVLKNKLMNSEELLKVEEKQKSKFANLVSILIASLTVVILSTLVDSFQELNTYLIGLFLLSFVAIFIVIWFYLVFKQRSCRNL